MDPNNPSTAPRPTAWRSFSPPKSAPSSYPGPAVIVTAQHGERRAVMPAGWHTALSAKPPLYGVAIAKGRATHAVVVASGTFGVHLMGFEHAELMQKLGRSSSRDGDKFAKHNIALAQPLALDVPLIADAWLAYECRTVAVHAVGDHDLFVGEVMAEHRSEAALDEDGLLPPERHPAFYLGRSTWTALGPEAPRQRFWP